MRGKNRANAFATSKGRAGESEMALAESRRREAERAAEYDAETKRLVESIDWHAFMPVDETPSNLVPTRTAL